MNLRALSTVHEVRSGTRRYTQHTVYELAETIRERDLVTYEHCRRVAIYVNRLARHMGWPRRAARDLALAGLVHDLGKTWMQNSVLHKESALSQDEWSQMRRHPAIAARILETYGVSESLVDVVQHHHEAFDGHGYPDRLVGAEIPLGARLLTVADVFDALTSARSYKEPMSVAEARQRIEVGAGTHFDPEVVHSFVQMLDADPDFQLPSSGEAGVQGTHRDQTERAWDDHDVPRDRQP